MGIILNDPGEDVTVFTSLHFSVNPKNYEQYCLPFASNTILLYMWSSYSSIHIVEESLRNAEPQDSCENSSIINYRWLDNFYAD